MFVITDNVILCSSYCVY